MKVLKGGGLFPIEKGNLRCKMLGKEFTET